MTAAALEPVRIAVHLSAGEEGATSGTFVATGLLGDTGAIPRLERFPALALHLDVPLVVHGAESFAGRAGTIAIAYDGVFRPVAPGVFAGEGSWRVSGGDLAYDRLDASGFWRSTAVFGRDGLAVDTLFEGSGTMR
jgi:hypothetical protein